MVYLILGKKFGFYLSCPIHTLFGVYCPGCGITRMLHAIITLDFYKAFRYNPLLFILFPFFVYLFIDMIIKERKNKRPILKKIPEIIWVILIIILIIYAILRNIYPFLAPIK